MVAPPEDHVPRDEWDWKSNGLPETRFIYSIPVLPDPLISQTSQDPPKPSLQTLTKTRSGSYPPAGRDALRTFSLALSLSLSTGPLSRTSPPKPPSLAPTLISPGLSGPACLSNSAGCVHWASSHRSASPEVERSSDRWRTRESRGATPRVAKRWR